ncbi:transcriptional regulator, MarR family [Novosphingobium aromaticivorans DSM 12444]|uniref:Transcriptional regulator, MarR family n=1 Tax=Novosphingobium aromaticivorans (strain ATCC 700278 / DSM 12444 / CCUG 56034 / CIP 105152 / NBRC 16084 / F199) TaxID=279238 RepID=Q2G9F5_NOVAD|nr:MarR family transcriptional regulator [Novosphingobium aromaticivorans]ABD25518.1 transcriptional regulator, MarR family [Novosphingobium aromaticivorans DSM 12444]SCX96133.1 transcriptional regulator, MarR family [Novosphingobium aromaticivorans]
MPGTQTRLSDFMPYRMAITSNAVSGLISGEYRSEFGLKIPEWRIMAVLGDAGSLTQRDLVRATLMDKVAVNRACKVLEQRGLVQRSPNEQDGRSHHLEFTPAGRELHGKIWPQAVHIYEKIFSSITEREKEKLRSILDKLLKAARAIEGDDK